MMEEKRKMSNKVLQQPIVSDMLHPDIEKLIRFTIKQWSSLDEQREPDHEELVNHWLNSTLKEWIKKNEKSLREIE